MAASGSRVPRIRQAVLAAGDLEAVTGRLRSELGLGEAFQDPAVEYFGLHNAVFALRDTYLEVVSPVREDAPAARLLARRGGDCGYMVMFEVDDLAGARGRAAEAGVREVFEVDLADMSEVHLHPADMRGAIVSLSQPKPAGSWRWGGPQSERRAADLEVVGVTIAVGDPDALGVRWRGVVGALPGVRFVADDAEPGLVEIRMAAGSARQSVEISGVRFVFEEEDAA